MSNTVLSFHRIANRDFLRKAKVRLSELECQYTDQDGRLQTISQKERSSETDVEIPGTDCLWDACCDDLVLTIRADIPDPTVFFNEDDGIAVDGSELGVAMVVSSSDSMQRFTVDSDASLINSRGRVTALMTARLDRFTFRKSLKITVIMYLKKRSDSDSPPYLASIEGSVLSELGFVNLSFEERPPEFPTRYRNGKKDDPLWTLDISWEDPFTETLEDTVCVYINESHHDFKDIMGRPGEPRNQAMMTEIYSSAVFQMILRLQANPSWNDIVDGNPDLISEGSVADYVYFMLNQVLCTDGADPLTLYNSIHKVLSGRGQ